MAALAGSRHVAPGEREPRQCMIELFDAPGLVAVARLAGSARLAFMLVVFLVAAVAFQRYLAEAAQILVAGHALDRRLGVSIAQHKLGSIMAEAPSGRLPVAFQVAIGTFLAQSGVVFVVLFVATDAFPGRLFEHRVFVAVLAFNLAVFTQQRKTALVMVEAGRLFPAALAMATAAILAQRFLVFIVFCMTGKAGLAQLDPVQVAGMANRACGRAMLATQDIFGIGVMAKSGGFPQVDAVAGLAFFTKLAFVAFGAVVVFPVAAHASERRVFVIACPVTRVTFDAGVLAGQGEARGPMVKLGFFPIGLVVAISALGAQGALVLVVLEVANAALR